MAMTENDILKADRLDSIFKRLGAALWMLQELEAASAMYFVMLAQARRGMGLEKGTEILSGQLRKTFGKTVRGLEESELLAPDLADRFLRFLKTRNWMIHDSLASGRGAIDSDEETQKFLARIEDVKAEALSLLKLIRELGEKYARTQGVTDDQIKKGIKVAKEQWFKNELI